MDLLALLLLVAAGVAMAGLLYAGALWLWSELAARVRMRG